MARFCQKCGKKLSLFYREVLCADCEKANKAELEKIEAERRNELKKAEEEILGSKDISENLLEILKNHDKNSLINLYMKVYTEFESDNELEENEIGVLEKIQTAFNLSNEDVKFDDLVRPYIYVNSIRKEENLPTLTVQISGSSQVILKKGEIVHFADKAVLNEMRSVSLGYSGGSHGISIPIVKGVRYRIGSHKGHIVKEDRLIQTSQGILIISNQRLLLHPFPGNKPLSIQLNKILSYQCFDNGLEVYKEGREKGYFFSLAKIGSVEIVKLCLGHLLK